MSKRNFVYAILLILVLISSFFCMHSLLKYMLITGHDQFIAFGRVLTEPEHGRYVSSFFGTMLVDRLPKILNMHTNDFGAIYVSVFKSVLVMIVLLMFTYTGFLFSKNKNRVLSLPFIILYSLLFLALFNNGYFFPFVEYYIVEFFCTYETMVFVEYPMSLLVFIPFYSFVFYYLITKKEISNKNYITLLITTFFLGISLEFYNVSTLIFMSILALYFIWGIFSKRISKPASLRILGVYIMYFISLVVYYIRPNDHSLGYREGSLWAYITANFSQFWQNFRTEYIYNEIWLLLAIIIALLLPFIFNKEEYKRNIKFSALVLLGIFSFMFCAFCVFFFGNVEPIVFSLEAKWTSCYKLILLFYFILSVGYVIDTNSKLTEKQTTIAKTVICLIVFAIFNKCLIFNYADNLKQSINGIKEAREKLYIAEKYVINQGKRNPDIKVAYMPKDTEKYCERFVICNRAYFTNLYKLYIDEIVFTDDYAFEGDFTEEELKELNFTNLLK